MRARSRFLGIIVARGEVCVGPEATQALRQHWAPVYAAQGGADNELALAYAERFATRFPMHLVNPPSTAQIGRYLQRLIPAAPGPDGIVYEAYHYGANAIAHLIGVALLAAQTSVAAATAVIGTNADALVWIPKEGGEK